MAVVKVVGMVGELVDVRVGALALQKVAVKAGGLVWKKVVLLERLTVDQ